jgi:hypothetical protein
VTSCLTQLKTRELMMELPSKRLLLRLVETRGKYLLPAELHAHFRVPKDHQDTVRRRLGHARWGVMRTRGVCMEPSIGMIAWGS